jgi:hypothetical protein
MLPLVLCVLLRIPHPRHWRALECCARREQSLVCKLKPIFPKHQTPMSLKVWHCSEMGRRRMPIPCELSDRAQRTASARACRKPPYLHLRNSQPYPNGRIYAESTIHLAPSQATTYGTMARHSRPNSLRPPCVHQGIVALVLSAPCRVTNPSIWPTGQ